MTVHVNGGSLTTHTKFYIKNYVEVWFQEHSVPKILSLKGIQRKFCVFYGSASGRNIILHNLDGLNVYFAMRADGLHYHDTKHRHMNIIHTANQMSEGYIQRKICHAKIAREFQDKFGHPSTHNLKDIISTYHVINCPVTVADIDRAETIFFPSLLVLKGKTTLRAPEIFI